MKKRSIWGHYIAWPNLHSFFFYKIITKFNRRCGRRFVVDRVFSMLLFFFKFTHKNPIFFIFKIFRAFVPLIGYRKRIRFIKNLRSKLDQSDYGTEFFIKDRRERKKAKDKIKIRKGKAKDMGRNRPHKRPKKIRISFPWTYSSYSRLKIGLRLLITNFRDTILGLPKIKKSFFFKFFFDFFGFFKKPKLLNALALKRKFYTLIYKSRIGLHYRW